MKKLITLVSNGDMEQHPDNTLTNFTNSFTYNLFPKKSMFFKVKIRSVMICSELKEDDPNAGIIKIFCKETEPHLGNSSVLDNCLGSFDVTHCDKHGNYLFYEFKHSLFIKITKVPFSQLSIFITNSVNQQLPLEKNFPTFIVLEISDENMDGQFQVTCYSHSLSATAENLFPSNTFTDFTVSLPSELELGANWEVAMANISFPPQLHDKIFWIKVAGQTLYFNTRDSTDVTSFMNKVVRRFNGFYHSNQIQLKELYLDNRLKGISINRGKRHKPPVRQDPEEEEEDRERRRQHHESAWTAHIIPVTFSKEFAAMFGHRDGRFKKFLLRSRDSKFFERKYFYPDFMRQCRPTPMSMLYCDIVQPSFVAEQQLSLLQMIPVEDYMNKDVSTFYVPRQLIFHPIVPYKIKNIRFSLCQTEGSPNSFITQGGETFQDSVVITLLFRPRKK